MPPLFFTFRHFAFVFAITRHIGAVTIAGCRRRCYFAFIFIIAITLLLLLMPLRHDASALCLPIFRCWRYRRWLILRHATFSPPLPLRD